MKKKITCIISCYNEKKNLPRLLLDIQRTRLTNYIKFIIINNGSCDGSFFTLNTLKIRFKEITFVNLIKGKGWGSGIKQGIKLSDTPVVGWTHGDLEYDINKLKKVVKIFKSNLVLFVNRPNFYIKGFRINRNFKKKIISYLMGLICSLILKKKLVEINSQPFFFSKKMLKEWKKIPDDLSLDLYAYYKMKNNAREFRISVTQNERIYGTSSWNRGINSKISLAILFVKKSLEMKK